VEIINSQPKQGPIVEERKENRMMMGQQVVSGTANGRFKSTVEE